MVTVGKKIPVHAATLKKEEWTPEQISEFTREFYKKKLPADKEKAIRDELATLAKKLSDNKDLANMPVSDNDQIKEILNKHSGVRACFYCMSPNCFSNAKEALKLSSEVVRSFNKRPKASNIQATFSTQVQPESVISEDAQAFYSSEFYTEGISAGFKESSTYTMGIRARVAITKATLPDVDKWELTPFAADKHCIICLRQKMDLGDVEIHLVMDHDGLLMRSPLEDWLKAKEDFGSDVDIDYDSED